MKDWIILIIACIAVYYFLGGGCAVTNRQLVQRVERNYGKEIEKICHAEKVSPNYFKALIILETSAIKPPKSRFEAHVFQALKNVRDGKQKKYGNLTAQKLRNRPDSELKLMATSWGALQIMGYHCLELGVSIDHLKGENNLLYGVRWCKKNYGKFLDKKSFKDAFHIHNTGQVFPSYGIPQTHDFNYVGNGLAYMEMMQ